MNQLTSLSLLFVFLSSFATSAQAEEEADLISSMGAFQYYTQKTGLAIDHQNKPLASFYVHEIEHILKDVMKVAEFDGHPVGKQAQNILKPAFEQLEKALKTKSWNEISATFNQLLDSCNRCHKATNHSFIHITRQTNNPYMQSFAP